MGISMVEHARQMATLVVVVAETRWQEVWKAFLFSKIIKFLRSGGCDTLYQSLPLGHVYKMLS